VGKFKDKKYWRWKKKRFVVSSASVFFIVLSPQDIFILKNLDGQASHNLYKNTILIRTRLTKDKERLVRRMVFYKRFGTAGLTIGYLWLTNHDFGFTARSPSRAERNPKGQVG